MKKLPHGVRQRIAKLIEDGLTASEIALFWEKDSPSTTLLTLHPAQGIRLSSLSWLENGEQVVLIGKSGSGKTHCAHVLSQLAIDSKGYDVLYAHSSHIIGPSNNEGSLYPPYVRCKHVDLLVIDNVGRDDASKRSAELLEALLHSRIENKLPTIITMAQEMNSTIDMIQSESESSASNTSSPLIDCFLKFMSKAYKIQMAPTNHYRDQALARAKEAKD